MRPFSLRNIFFILLPLTCLSLLSSCENEVDVNADWKEVVVVYALLDPLDSVQYVKINKAFQNNKTGALQAAQVTDSLFLPVNAKLIRLSNNQVINLVVEENVKKDSGIFANQKNTLYKTSEKIIAGEKYRLEITSINTGKTLSAEALVVSPATILSPFRDSTNNFSISGETIVVNFSSGLNTAVYDVRMEVMYQEFPINDTNSKVTKTVTWRMLTNVKTQNTLGQNNLIARVPRLAFFQFLRNTITTSTSLQHRFLRVNMVYYGGSEMLADYISVSEPSIGIVQKQADYTNIEGGTGIFASRCVQKIVRVPLDPFALKILQSNAETAPLNFIP